MHRSVGLPNTEEIAPAIKEIELNRSFEIKKTEQKMALHNMMSDVQQRKDEAYIR